MCCACWHEEYGEARVDNPKVRELASLIDDIDDFGHLHIIVDDWNLEDSSIDFCEKELNANTKEYPTKEELAKERDFLSKLRALSLEERASAFGLNSGCWKG